MSESSEELVLDLGGDRAELGRINAAVEGLAEKHGWPADISYQVVLVLEELQMNIWYHAYPKGKTPHSTILIRVEPKTLTIEMKDQGVPFNPLEETSAPDLDASLEDRQIGGLGVHLVKNFMDKMDYKRVDDSNHLTLVKNLP